MEKVMKFTGFSNTFVLIASIALLSNPLAANSQSSTSITERYGLLGKEPNMMLWYETIKGAFRIGDARQQPATFGRPTPITDKHGKDTKLWYEEMKREYFTSK